ncbi:hypothetical protein IJ182_08100 [bacterium]|nr:hypothetical protein [bacterium]
MINTRISSNKIEKCYIPDKEDSTRSSKASIQYRQMQVPVKDILCVREMPDCYINPKSVVTLIEKNPNTGNLPLVTEYEYAGSLDDWKNACEKAQAKNTTVKLDMRG